MKDFLTEIVENLIDEELFQAYNEYEELSATGVLKQGIARWIETKYKEKYQIKTVVIESVRLAVYHEMATRYYKKQNH